MSVKTLIFDVRHCNMLCRTIDYSALFASFDIASIFDASVGFVAIIRNASVMLHDPLIPNRGIVINVFVASQ